MDFHPNITTMLSFYANTQKKWLTSLNAPQHGFKYCRDEHHSYVSAYRCSSGLGSGECECHGIQFIIYIIVILTKLFIETFCHVPLMLHTNEAGGPKPWKQNKWPQQERERERKSAKPWKSHQIQDVSAQNLLNKQTYKYWKITRQCCTLTVQCPHLLPSETHTYTLICFLLWVLLFF